MARLPLLLSISACGEDGLVIVVVMAMMVFFIDRACVEDLL